MIGKHLTSPLTAASALLLAASMVMLQPNQALASSFSGYAIAQGLDCQSHNYTYNISASVPTPPTSTTTFTWNWAPSHYGYILFICQQIPFSATYMTLTDNSRFWHVDLGRFTPTGSSNVALGQTIQPGDQMRLVGDGCYSVNGVTCDAVLSTSSVGWTAN